MGNWRTVAIVGTCDHAEVEALRAACRGYAIGPLAVHGIPSIFGIDDWPAAEMMVVGNCSERDYSVESIARDLRALVQSAPSLRIKVHCGGEYEDKTCVATVTVEGGEVTVGPPEEKAIPEPGAEHLRERLERALRFSP